MGWGRWKRRVSRWLMAGGQPAPPRHRQPPAQGCCRAFCPRGGLGISAIPVRKLASGQLFSAPARPTNPDSPSCPCLVRAVWSSAMALGRLRANVELYCARWVRASNLQIRHVPLSHSPDHVFCRLWAISKCIFLSCRDVANALAGSRVHGVSRRGSTAESRQKPTECSSQAGATSTSSTFPFASLQ